MRLAGVFLVSRLSFGGRWPIVRFLAEVGVQKSLPDGQGILTLVSCILAAFRHQPIDPLIWTPFTILIAGLVSWFLQ